MNNIHKVIFNQSTQQFIVVSELARSAGKPKAVSADTLDIVSLLQNFSEKRPLALGAAAKAYSTAGDLANGGALFRVETGTGFSHSRERNETASRESVGNQLNAQHIDITSRSGDINATHTAFTSKDGQGNRLKDSSITFNSAKDLNLNAGQSEYRMKGRQQSSSVEVGTGVAVGAQTGWYVYAQAGFSHGKQDEYHLTHQNSQIDTDTLNINTQGNTTLKGAVAKANTINADIKGNLTVENLQDIHQSESDSAGFGGRVQVAIGTAWGGSAYGNMASGSSNVKQVVEQSGLFAEEGGYHITANNVELTGGAIASHNPANSTLTTNTITFKDIQNESSSQAVSAGISASANLNKQAGTEAKTEAKAKQQAKVAKLTGTSQSNGINPSVPMFDSSRDSSVTKATLTEGTIILNKDTHPTQTTAKALGINTDLSQANRQVEQPKDINQVLKEQQILSQAAGNVAGAVMTYAENQKIELQQAEQKAREAAEEAAKSGDTTMALAKLQEAERLKTEVERWETGGDNKRKATVVATALSLAVAGKPAEAIAAGAASPYINEAIKHITENTDSKTLEALNIPLHILWGAVEAELAGGNAKAGAVATGVGEIGARVLAESVYGKQPRELTEEEKQNLLTTSKALAGIAVASTNGGSGAETLANASVGIVVAENAVENNLLLTDYSNLKGLAKSEIEEHRKTIQLLKDNGIENIDDYAKIYENCSSEQCRKEILDKLNKSFDKAYDKIDELAKLGQLTSNDIEAIDEYVVRVRSAYDSKRFSDVNGDQVYFAGLINVLGKNEDRLNQARLYATVSNWAQQGYSQEQIENKLSAENLAVILSSASVSLSKQGTSTAKTPIVTKQQISEIIKGTVSVSRSKYPETVSHIEDSIGQGKPAVLTIDRKGAAQRRKEALMDTPSKTGYDRDEYPPAMFKEGGKGASVRYISPKDNRGAGSCIGHQCKQYSDGDKVKIEIKE